MKKLMLLISFLSIVASAIGSTSITRTNVSGRWTTTGSPYLIYNDIEVPYDSTLVIDAGVDVIFQGSYELKIAGVIKANGTIGNSIRFYRSDTTGLSDTTRYVGGWKGISTNYGGSTADSSVFTYCDIYYIKDGITTHYQPVDFRYCNFFHNRGNSQFLSFTLNSYGGLGLADITKCKFFDNHISGSIFFCYGGELNFSYNEVYDNSTFRNICIFARANVVIKNNSIHHNFNVDTIGGVSTIALEKCKGVVWENKIYSNLISSTGAIACWQSQIDINRNYICNNHVYKGDDGTSGCLAVAGGGAIRLDGMSDTSRRICIVRNNIIANNFSNLHGAGVFIFRTNAKIYNNQFVNNYTKTSKMGAIYMLNYGNYFVSIKNNVFWNNVSPNATSMDTTCIAVGFADSLEFSYNYMQHPVSNSFYAGYTNINHLLDTSHNIIATSSQLISPTLTQSDTESALTADFHLLPISLCINKGDTVNASPTSTDYWLNSRFVGAKIDIGAHEYNPFLETTIPASTKLQFSIFPNPCKGKFYATVAETNGSLIIYNLLGEIVKSVALSQIKTEINIESLSSGVYFAVWNDSNGSAYTEKLLVE